MSSNYDPRIFFAAERTLLAWNRTAIALIAFGFLIERSGMLLLTINPEMAAKNTFLLTFLCGVGFILLGILCAISSSKQFIAFVKTLRPEDLPEGYGIGWAIFINWAVVMMAAILVIIMYVGISGME